MFGKAQRTSRLDVLVKTIAAMRPETVDQLKGNLFVFLENLQESEVTQSVRLPGAEGPGNTIKGVNMQSMDEVDGPFWATWPTNIFA